MVRMHGGGLIPTRVLQQLLKFLQHGSASGIILMGMAVLAIVLANSPAEPLYSGLLSAKMTIGFGAFSLTESMLHWINDGLMAIFFLLVSLEIKRELIEGQLSSVDQALLPCLAALGGVVAPALIYSYFAWGNAEAMRGWAIPSATDIAFSLGVISLLGSRVPVALKVFLTTLAVVDDLAAVAIIAAFYTADLSSAALLVALGCILVLVVLNRLRVRSLTLFLLVGVVLWVAVLKSGVHATLAGVVLGFLIPLKQREEDTRTPILYRLEHALHPWVAYGIMPLFALANAGLSFAGMSVHAVADPVTLGILLGLFVGKPLGIFGVSWVAIRTGLAKMPVQSDWASLFAVSCLAGIGFTMSLFIAGLAFTSPLLQAEARLGILVGSFVSAVLGYLLFVLRARKNTAA
jgi:NhaA family Na+:H+ antiporter